MDQLELGLQLKAEGQERARKGAADWHEEALAWLSKATGAFTADDLVEALGLPHESAQNRNGAVGAAIGAAQKMGLIHATGWRRSTRKICHGRVIAVWEPKP